MKRKKKPEVSTKSNIYFPALDGLRFFAFLSVFLHHSLQNFHSDFLPLNFFYIIFQKNGWVGVDLFFVLSGFLITYLLLSERQKYGNFMVKNFWIRRLLRIWPLYYLALIVGFIIIPNIIGNFSSHSIEFTTQLPFYLTFLGNWAVITWGYSSFHYIGHLWTISIEEQFYILWPILLLFTKKLKFMVLLSLSLILIATLVRLVLSLNQITHPGIYVNTFARLDTLTLGSLLGIIYFHQPKLITLLPKLCKSYLQLFVIILFALFLFQAYLFDPTNLLYSVFGYTFIALVMSFWVFVSLNTKSLLSHFLKFRPFVFLGKISYGLYVWHILAIDLVASFFHTPINTFIALSITIILAIFSYYCFEIYFLKLKKRFTKINSREI